MTAVAAGALLIALSPVPGVQALGAILAMCGAAWLWVRREEEA